MTQRSKNLLEAFNDSSQVEKTREAKPAKKRRSLANVGGPFAPSAIAGKRESAPKRAPELVRPKFAGVLSQNPSAKAFLRNGLPVYLAVALVFFLIGRASVQRVDAAPADPAGPAIGRAQVPGAIPPTAPVGDQAVGDPLASSPTPLPLEVEGLHDRANKYTILAAQYVLTDSAKELGWNAYSHLKGRGFQVFPLYAGTTHYKLFVEASGESAKLDQALAEIRRLPGPNGRKDDFATARVVMIDTFVDRD
jgi:hypothetical protein